MIDNGIFNNIKYLKERGSYPKKNPLLMDGSVCPLSHGLPSVWQPIERELQVVFEQLKGSLRKVGKGIYEEYMYPTDYEYLLPPGLVLYSGNIFSEKRDHILPAVLMELIYLGTGFHNRAGRIRGKKQQMYILTGDYLSSHLFYLLYKTNTLFLLDELSSLIITMCKGFSNEEDYRLRGYSPNKKEIYQYTNDQYGAFYGECCALGGLFVGCSEEEQSLLRDFGTAFGIAYGVQKKGYNVLPINDILNKGYHSLFRLPDSNGRRELENLAQKIILD